LELAAVGGGERCDKRLLRRVEALVQPLQSPNAGTRHVDDDAPLVLLIADARHEPITFELIQQRMHVTAIDQQSSSKRRLTDSPSFGEGAQHDEMLTAQAGAGKPIRNQASGRCGDLAHEPARQLRDPAGRVVGSVVCRRIGHVTI
jgi:hypothetical protein